MANNDLFGFVGTQGMTNTNPIQVNAKPDLRAANAFNSIAQLAETSMKFGTQLQNEANRTSYYEASKQSNELHDWFNQEVVKTDDPFKQKELLDQYKLGLDSIEKAYDLPIEYASALSNSNKRFVGDQDRIIGKAVRNKQLSIVDDGIATMTNASTHATVDEKVQLMNDMKQSYIDNFGMSEADANDRIFRATIGAKLANLKTDDPLNMDVKGLKSEYQDLMEKFDPFLKNKDFDVKVSSTLQQLEKHQQSAIKEYLTDYVNNDATNMSKFKEEADKYKDKLSSIDYDNFVQVKQKKLKELAIHKQVLADAAENKVNKIFNKQLTGVLHDPYMTKDKLDTYLQEGVKRGVISEEQRTAHLNTFDVVQQQGIDAEAKKKADEEAKVATRLLSELKINTSTKDGMLPQQFAGLVSISSKGLPTGEQLKDISNYEAQYKYENDTLVKTQVMNAPKTEYLGKPGADGIKQGITNDINNFYNDGQNFNAQGIILLFKNHDIKGNVATSMTHEVSNTDTLNIGLTKFNALNNTDKSYTKALLGDDLYSRMSAYAAVAKKDKEGKLIVEPNDYKDINDKINNPKAFPVDEKIMKEVHKSIKDNPALFQYYEQIQQRVILGKEKVGDIIDDYATRIKTQNPIVGLNLNSYSANINSSDKDVLKTILDINKKADKAFTGITYNDMDKSFYFSRGNDNYYAKIVNKDSNGNSIPVQNLNDLLTMYLPKIKEADVNVFGTKRQTLGELSDTLLKLNPVYNKETDSYQKQK